MPEMNIQLMRLRKAAGYTNRDVFASKIGVNKYTYRSWESGAAMMNAEQVWDCAVALNCTPNDILGWKESGNDNALNSTENELIDCYRESTPEQKDMIMMSARNAALVSKSAAECDPLRRADEAAC